MKTGGSQNILVTGGAGFIGSAVATLLAAEGHSVRSMDISPHATAGEVLHGDVTDSKCCARACEGMDAVIHAAGVHHVDEVAAAPNRMLDVNVGGTSNILRAAVDAGVRRVVYLSTGKVYGEPDQLPSHEHHTPVPLEIYARAKVEAEGHCRAVQQDAALGVVVIRPFSVYGPRQDLATGYVGMVIRALRGEVPLALPADPGFLRDFVHITDVARLCGLAATTPLAGYPVLNAGSGRATRLDELIAMASALSQRPLTPQWLAARPSAIRRTHAAMLAAEEALGFTPTVTLEKGLAETLDWFLTTARREVAS